MEGIHLRLGIYGMGILLALTCCGFPGRHARTPQERRDARPSDNTHEYLYEGPPLAVTDEAVVVGMPGPTDSVLHASLKRFTNEGADSFVNYGKSSHKHMLPGDYLIEVFCRPGGENLPTVTKGNRKYKVFEYALIQHRITLARGKKYRIFCEYGKDANTAQIVVEAVTLLSE